MTVHPVTYSSSTTQTGWRRFNFAAPMRTQDVAFELNKDLEMHLPFTVEKLKYTHSKFTLPFLKAMIHLLLKT
jgi:hypothetical protein